jgi:hypothetical protein
MKLNHIIPPSTLENIDTAVYLWLSRDLNLFCDTNKGSRKVPVVWSGAERVFLSKENIRDNSGAVIFPIISIERTGIKKPEETVGMVACNVPPVGDFKGGTISIGRRIKQDKTANFANADMMKSSVGQINFKTKKVNEKIVYENLTIPLPVYLEVTYNIVVETEYQQHLNTLMAPFINLTGRNNRKMVENNGHKYEIFIESDYKPTSNSSKLGEDERRFKSEISLKVIGYTMGEEMNRDQPFVTIRENAVEVRLPNENVVSSEELSSLYPQLTNI